MPVAEPGSTPEKKFVGEVGPASIVRLRTKTSVESFDGMPTPARPSPPAKQTRPSHHPILQCVLVAQFRLLKRV